MAYHFSANQPRHLGAIGVQQWDEESVPLRQHSNLGAIRVQ